MKSLELTGFTQMSTEDLQNVDGGGLISSLLGQVEGVVNPLAALLDSLIASLPIPALPSLPGIGGLSL